jgi:hypothetical protein
MPPQQVRWLNPKGATLKELRSKTALSLKLWLAEPENLSKNSARVDKSNKSPTENCEWLNRSSTTQF